MKHHRSVRSTQRDLERQRVGQRLSVRVRQPGAHADHVRCGSLGPHRHRFRSPLRQQVDGPFTAGEIDGNAHVAGFARIRNAQIRIARRRRLGILANSATRQQIVYVPALFHVQFGDFRQHRHLSPAAFDLLRRECLVDDETHDRLLAGQRRDHDVGVRCGDRDRARPGEGFDQRLLAGLLEMVPEVSELPFAIRIRQAPSVMHVRLVVRKAERVPRQFGIAGGVLDDDAAAGFELAERGEDLRRFVRRQPGQEQHAVAGQLPGQHIFRGEQHAGPPHPRQVVQDDAGPLMPVGVVHRDVRQRVERREPRTEPFEEPQQRLGGTRHRKPVEPPADRAERDRNLFTAGVVCEELAVQLLARLVAHRQEGRRPEVAPRRQAVVRVVDGVALRQRGVGRRRVRFPTALIEAGDRIVRRQTGPHLADIGQIFTPRVRQHGTVEPRTLPAGDSPELVVGVAFSAVGFDLLVDLLLHPLIRRLVPPRLVAVQWWRLLPVAAPFGEPAERNPAQPCHVSPRLHEQREPAAQLGQIFGQRVLRVPVLVMQHRRIGRDGPHALAGECHQRALFVRRPDEFLGRRTERRVGIAGERRVERSVSVGQEGREPRTARQAAVIRGDGRAAVRLRVVVDVGIDFEVADGLALTDAQTKRIAHGVRRFDRDFVLTGREGGGVKFQATAGNW